MGLDMYLYAQHHIVRYDHDPEGTQLGNEVLATLTGATGIAFDRLQEPSNIIEIRLTAAYWRKANAIHNWFVRKVQGGEDDCGHYYVSRERLVELADLCDRLLRELRLEDGTIHVGTRYSQAEGTVAMTEEGQVIANPELADELLPTTGGFFFGSTAYNQYYLEDLRYTRDRLREVLAIAAENSHIYFEYHSSW